MFIVVANEATGRQVRMMQCGGYCGKEKRTIVLIFMAVIVSLYRVTARRLGRVELPPVSWTVYFWKAPV
jgi:hypothetical protein